MGAEVELLRVGLVGVEVIGPVGPGPEHHDGAPDEHGEVHDGHDAGGEAVDGHAHLLPAVDLTVTLSALLVDLGQGIGGVRDQEENAGNPKPISGAIRTEIILIFSDPINISFVVVLWPTAIMAPPKMACPKK